MSASGKGGGASSFPPMRAGALRRKLTIQSASTTPDGLGGVTSTWTDVLTTWGSVTAKSASPFLQLLAGQRMAIQAYDIVIRYPPSLAIEPGMRVVDGSRAYIIGNVTDTDERHRVMHLSCSQAPAT
jgi:SPP1 family predicted phage head-tail adaptor